MKCALYSENHYSGSKLATFLDDRANGAHELRVIAAILTCQEGVTSI